MGAEVLAVEAGFVAVDEVEDARFGGEGAESHGCQETGMEHGCAVFVVFGYQAAIHSVALDVPDALLAPARYGHGVSERFLERCSGTELIVKSGDEVEESLGFLAAEQDMGGENAVFDSVAGRGEFAVGRDRSLTTGASRCFSVVGIRPDRFTAVWTASVGAGSFDLEGSAHFGDSLIARVGGGTVTKVRRFVDFRGDINIPGVNRERFV